MRTGAAEAVTIVTVVTDATEAAVTVVALCIGITSTIVHSAFVYL